MTGREWPSINIVQGQKTRYSRQRKIEESLWAGYAAGGYTEGSCPTGTWVRYWISNACGVRGKLRLGPVESEKASGMKATGVPMTRRLTICETTQLKGRGEVMWAEQKAAARVVAIFQRSG